MFKRKGIPVVLDRKRYLKLDFEAMVIFENLTGKPLFLLSTIKTLTVNEIGILIWLCLRHEGLGLEETGKILLGLDKKKWNDLAEKIPLAWRNAQIR